MHCNSKRDVAKVTPMVKLPTCNQLYWKEGVTVMMTKILVRNEILPSDTVHRWEDVSLFLEPLRGMFHNYDKVLEADQFALLITLL